MRVDKMDGGGEKRNRKRRGAIRRVEDRGDERRIG